MDRIYPMRFRRICLRHRRRRILMLLAVVLLTATFAQAQPATQPATQPAAGFGRPDGLGFGGQNGGQNTGQNAGRGEMMIERLRDAMSDLNLTDDQKTKIRDIFSNAREQMQQMAGEVQNLPPQQRQEKVRQFITDVRNKVRDVLTDEQAAKMREKMEASRGQRGGGQAGDRPVDRDGRNENDAFASSTRPASPSQSTASQLPPGQRPEAVFDRLKASLADLHLSSDQQKQVQVILDDGRKQLGEAHDKMLSAGANADEARFQSQKIFAGMRDQLAGILSRDQQELLRDEIQSRYNHDNPPTTTPPTANAPAPPPPKPAMMQTDPFAPDSRPPAHAPPSSPKGAPSQQVATPPNAAPAAPPIALLKVGDAAPDFQLDRLDGRPVQLSAFKGRPMLIEFGSYTSPSFRQRVAGMEELGRQYNSRVAFLLIYTKEAHPSGEQEIDRNKTDRISVVAHTDLMARKTAARNAKQALHITLPIAVDSMDDQAANAYGGGENAAIVIGRDGKIAAKENWADPFRLRVALDEALAIKPTTKPATAPVSTPLAR